MPADDAILAPNGGWDERVLVFRRAPLVDAYAVVSQRFVVLVDTLDNPASAGVMLASVRDRVLAGRQLLIVNTHADWDHCWGNAIFDGPDAAWCAPIIGHRRCRERLLSAEAAAGLATAQADDPARFGTVRLAPPTITLEQELTIDGGDLTLVLLPTPGHQPDHLSVWLPEPRLLLAGDAAEQPIPAVGEPASLPALRASLQRLAALEPAVVLASHAPGSATPDLLAANLAYFDTLEQRCRAALARGLPRPMPAAADLAALVGFPAAVAVASGDLPPDQEAFYHRAHHAALQAMLAWLTGQA